jgi:beta-lactamase superfamily II metal-dependent hydrolase
MSAAPVEISVLHGGFERAEYPLIVGTFDGEHLSDPERFLDRQFGGQLSSRAAIHQYPRRVGESVFITPSDGTVTEPPGAYVLGLGRAADLTRSVLSEIVARALVSRCIGLYPLHADDDEVTCDVGVSSTLIGVRNGDLLRVEDAVVGVVQGTLRANEELADYERARRIADHRVRIGALQFVERYADRADLAVAALRALATSVSLTAGYEYLRTIVARSAPGSRPPGADLIESTRRYRRFLITERPGPPSTEDDHLLELDVAVIGGSARTDRIHHRLDRRMVDALLTRLTEDRTDMVSAATLYDLLVPRELHDQFVTTTSVQFVVDSTTANYPWELVTVPRPTGAPTLAAAGGVIRQFVDDDTQRWLAGDSDSSGGALIIGSGKVPGFAELPGVYAEAKAVSDRLGDLFVNGVRRLDDAARPLDLVELQNALFGDHRVLHVCGHGVFEEGRSDRTGVVLAKDVLLTVDTVRQLRKVPELVVLNCCSLGRIGGSRLAAGLARGFMAAGARAVVAAGWPVTDAAALAFASTMYDELVEGRQFGDAISRARLACQEADGSATWAAYQCYGDPSFVLLGGATSRTSPFFAPVSDSDLVARLQSLSVKISDLGRVGHGDVTARRAQLRQQWTDLAEWAEARPTGRRPVEVGRLLRSTLRDLGDLDLAAARYVELCTTTDDPNVPVRVAPGTTPDDILDAADCLSRVAQAEGRRCRDEGRSLDDVRASFDVAERLARLATGILMRGSAPPVIGAVLLRRATIELERRPALLAEAVEHFRSAVTGRPDVDLELLAQLVALRVLPPDTHTATEGFVLAERAAASATGGGTTPERRVDQRVASSSDFDDRVLAAQFDLATALEATKPLDCQARARSACERFQHAFDARSTWMQRSSVVGHLDDIIDLLAVDDPRRPHIARCRASLVAWERRHVDGEEPEEAPAPASSAPESAPVTTHQADPAEPTATDDRSARPRLDEISLTAFPAGCGDALLIEYGKRTSRRRILVDGGLGSAYERGLGAYIAAQPGSVLDVDLAVVTHIDLDHIEGVVEAIGKGHLRADDLWFNGLDEIDALLGAERGPRQGDELVALVPGDQRNQATAGVALHLPDDDLPVTIELGGGARCTVLGPTRQRLQRLATKWRAAERGPGAPTGDPVRDLCARFEDDTVRGGPSFGGDRAVANGSSIAMLLEVAGRSMLLTGDAFADDLEQGVQRVLDERGGNRLAVDLFKLSHHGSRGNLTPALLQLIDPAAVLVCTDGTKFSHPDEDAIALVRSTYPNAPIHFTDDTPLIRQRAETVGGLLPGDGPTRLVWRGR